MKNYERQYLLLVFFVEQLHLLVEVGSKKAVLDDTVSDSDDHIQIVVFKITVDLVVALLANC